MFDIGDFDPESPVSCIAGDPRLPRCLHMIMKRNPEVLETGIDGVQMVSEYSRWYKRKQSL